MEFAVQKWSSNKWDTLYTYCRALVFTLPSPVLWLGLTVKQACVQTVNKNSLFFNARVCACILSRKQKMVEAIVEKYILGIVFKELWISKLRNIYYIKMSFHIFIYIAVLMIKEQRFKEEVFGIQNSFHDMKSRTNSLKKFPHGVLHFVLLTLYVYKY